MNSNDTVALALLTAFMAVLAYWATGLVIKAWRRKRIHCAFGQHRPGPIRTDIDSHQRIQRCDYCDKVVGRYKLYDRDTTIRRIH